MTKKRVAIYPGTFDPVTNGHIDIIRRALNICDHLVVSVALNSTKNPLFPIEQRVDFIKKGLKGLKNVDVLPFDNLLTDFARVNNAAVIIKGLRAVSDFEYELQLANMNRAMSPDLESIFLTPKAKFSFLSSTLVRAIASMGGEISSFVDPIIEEALKKRFKL